MIEKAMFDNEARDPANFASVAKKIKASADLFLDILPLQLFNVLLICEHINFIRDIDLIFISAHHKSNYLGPNTFFGLEFFQLVDKVIADRQALKVLYQHCNEEIKYYHLSNYQQSYKVDCGWNSIIYSTALSIGRVKWGPTVVCEDQENREEGLKKVVEATYTPCYWEIVGEQLHSQKHESEDEDSKKESYRRKILQGTEDHFQKLLEISPILGKLEDTCQSEDSEGCDRTCLIITSYINVDYDLKPYNLNYKSKKCLLR